MAELSRNALPLTRRRFLAHASALAAGTALAGCSSTGSPRERPRRVVLVRFGGGVRFEDCFGPEERSLTPFLRSLAERGTLFSELWNDHLTRHDTATLSLLTGRYGTRQSGNAAGDANVEELGQAALIGEAVRRGRSLPETKVLAAGVPDQSLHPAFGESYRAITFATEGSAHAERTLSGDPSLGRTPHVEMGNRRFGRIASDLASGFWPESIEPRRKLVEEAAAREVESEAPERPELGPVIAAALTERILDDEPYIAAEDADRWLTDLTIGALRHLRPDFTALAWSTPDLAHLGAWRSYVAQVRQLDVLLERLWRFLETDPYYRGRTTLLVTPDCGRGSERFDQHAEPADDPQLRRLFLVAAGVGIDPGTLVEDRRQQIDVAPTIARILEIDLPEAEGQPLAEISA